MVSGEAEYIWPRFCRDVQSGQHETLYREDGTVELADSPTPRFDLLKLHRYRMAPVQFSRGCPFRCEFCDIIVMFGRRPRTKAPNQVMAELEALRRAGVTDVFFVDDNFIGHKPDAKKLLDALRSYQEAHDWPFRFGTEASTDLARHTDLMEPMRDSGFEWVFLGIESPDPASLAETKKTQNLQQDLLESVHTIYRHGIDIMAGFIVGFDADTPQTFELQRQFLQQSGIQMANISMLQAMPKTPLYERLEAEGRLREGGGEGKIDVKLSTNIVPKSMSYQQLVEGYRELFLGLYTDEAIAERIVAKAGSLRRTRRARDESWIGPAARIASKGIAAGGPGRIRAAAGAVAAATKASSASEATTQALIDWGFALSVRSYLDRHFQLDDEDSAKAWQALEQRLTAAAQRGQVVLREQRPAEQVRRLVVEVRAGDGLRALDRASKQVLALMARSPIELELDLRAVAPDRATLARLLKRLRPYGTRIRIEATAEVIEDETLQLWRFCYGLPALSGRAREAAADAAGVAAR